jgi:hypothetical protein
VVDSDKHSSLLWYRINYDLKKSYDFEIFWKSFCENLLMPDLYNKSFTIVTYDHNDSSLHYYTTLLPKAGLILANLAISLHRELHS